MRARHKIFVFLSIVTLALGALVFLLSREDMIAIIRFRWLLFNHPIRNLSDAVTSLIGENPGSLWYGSLALFAIVITGFIIKFITSTELQAFKDRLIDAEVRKAELETLLQDSLWKERQVRVARDAALKDLDASLSSMFAMQDRLGETEKLLRTRNRGLTPLLSKSEVLAKPHINAAGEQEENNLREELRKKTDLLQEKESAVQKLEENLTGKVGSLETRLNLKEKLINERDQELKVLRAQLTQTEMATCQTEIFLTQELKAKDSALKELETSLMAKIRAFENRASENQQLLHRRSTEMEALRSELTISRARLTDLMSAKDRAETTLQQDLEKTIELLQSQDTAFKELHESSRAKLEALERELAEKDQLQNERDKELHALRAQLTQTGVAKNQAESFLAEELKKEKQALNAKDIAVKQVQESLASRIRALESQIREKQDLLQRRTAELDTLRSEMTALARQFTDRVSAQQQAEKKLGEELKKKTELLQSKDAAFKEREAAIAAKLHHLESKLRERDATLQEYKGTRDSLMAELDKMGSASDLLRDELGKATTVRKAQDSTIKGLEENFKKTVDALNNQVGEQQKLLGSRNEEIQTLRSEIDTLHEQSVTMGTVRNVARDSVHEQPSHETMIETHRESMKEVHALQSLLQEKEDLLKSHDQKIERLESELKEKRTALAKYEIGAWQAYERRTVWKQRLAKFGISIKDREL